MKIIALKPESSTYSCIPYLILGSWNRVEDLNTLIDPGPDCKAVVSQVESINTGLGKQTIDQIVFTHCHYDHAGCAKELKAHFNCRLYGMFAADFIDVRLIDRQRMRIADEEFQIIHAPYHSDDSVCLYCEQHGVMFTGDTTIRVQRNDPSFSQNFRRFIEWLAAIGLKTIYGGHDPPLTKDLDKVLKHSVDSLRQI